MKGNAVMATQREKMEQAVSLLKKLDIVLPSDFDFTSPNALSVLQGVIQTRNSTKAKMTAERANEIANDTVRSGNFRMPERKRDDDLAGDNSRGRQPQAFSERAGCSPERANRIVAESLRLNGYPGLAQRT